MFLLRIKVHGLLPISVKHILVWIQPQLLATHQEHTIIDAKLADIATAYTTIRKCNDIFIALGNHNVVHALYQQLYAIAQHVKWAFQDERGGDVLRMGGLHTLSSFITCVSKFWGDARFLNFNCTADEMLAGKQFNPGTERNNALTMKLASFVVCCEKSRGRHIVSPFSGDNW